MSVYKAINAVQRDLCVAGIGKNRKNQQQGYSFRGIDDMYNALAPILARHGLCILPRVMSRECVERQTAKGSTLFYVTVLMEFDFVCAEDASHHTVVMSGEAMDSADKATNKAMSAAYKYAAMQTFAIPTEGDNDADSTTHDVVPADAATKAKEDRLRLITDAIIAKHARDDRYGMYEEWVGVTDNEEKLAVWGMLRSHSKVRSAIKEQAEIEKQTEPQ
jgi:hypothetical protein